MTRTWVSRKDHRWVMVCDRDGCQNRSEKFPTGREPDLLIFAKRGWFIAGSYGDRCPECFDAGLLSDSETHAKPHRVMKAITT